MNLIFSSLFRPVNENDLSCICSRYFVLCHYIADTQGVHVVHFQPYPGTENTFCHFHLDAHVSQFPI